MVAPSMQQTAFGSLTSNLPTHLPWSNLDAGKFVYKPACPLFACRGKNFDRTFTHPKCPVRPMYPKFGQLVQLQQKYDPAEMLKPRLFQKVADKESYTYSPGCRYDLVH